MVSVGSLLKPGGLCTVSVYLPTEQATVGVSHTGFEMVSVNRLCPVSVKTWQSLYGLSAVSACLQTTRPSVGGQSPTFASSCTRHFWEALELQFDDKEA